MGNLNVTRRNNPARNAMNLENAAAGLGRGVKYTTGSLPR
jgi:hypothetical protein